VARVALTLRPRRPRSPADDLCRWRPAGAVGPATPNPSAGDAAPTRSHRTIQLIQQELITLSNEVIDQNTAENIIRAQSELAAGYLEALRSRTDPRVRAELIRQIAGTNQRATRVILRSFAAPGPDEFDAACALRDGYRLLKICRGGGTRARAGFGADALPLGRNGRGRGVPARRDREAVG
jgi:hypothetical protein